MPSSFRWRIPVVLLVVGVAAWYTFPLSKRINLGLDLQGGVHLVLRVDTARCLQKPEGRMSLVWRWRSSATGLISLEYGNP